MKSLAQRQKGSRKGIRLSIESKTSVHGDSFLHAACSAGASIDVIQYLTELDLKAAELQNNCGQLPLHLAKDYVTAFAVYTAFPDGVMMRDNQGNIPLHCACFRRAQNALEVIRCLWVCDKESHMARNNDGDLPIHLACEVHLGVDVLQFLAIQCPESLRIKGHQPPRPTASACLVSVLSAYRQVGYFRN